MRRVVLFTVIAAFVASSVSAQLPGLRRRTGPPPGPPSPLLMSIDALRADFTAKSGSSTVYFIGNSAGLTPQAQATLAAQAQWLLQHPQVVVRIEGHADLSDTRDHALAIGARRAEEVRSYLVLLGVPPAQVSASSWGKERPGAARAETILVR